MSVTGQELNPRVSNAEIDNNRINNEHSDNNIKVALEKLLHLEVSEQIEGVCFFRKFLARGNIQHYEISWVIDMGILPILKGFLDENSNEELVFESAWVITNIASGNSVHCKKIIEAGIMQSLETLLLSDSDRIAEQVIWAFGNIIGDSAQLRSDVLNTTDVLDKIIPYLSHELVTIRRNAVWTMSNFFRFKPRPAYEDVCHVYSSLAQRLECETDLEALTDLCWTFSYITDDEESHFPNIQEVLDTGAAAMLQIHLNGAAALKAPCLRALGNCVYGTEVQTQAILDGGLLPSVYPLLKASVTLQKEACWLLSNILAGTVEQKQCVLQPFDHEGIRIDIISRLVDILSVETDSRVVKEVWWCFGNATEGSDINMNLLHCEKLVPKLCATIDSFGTQYCPLPAIRALAQILCSGKKDILKMNKQLVQTTSAKSMNKVQEYIRNIETQQKQVQSGLSDTKLPESVSWLVSSYLYAVN